MLMDTINIINNFDQNILMENILILNQLKLLDLVFRVFEVDFKNIPIEELTLEYIQTHFDQLKFINYDLMIRLLNLKTIFNNKNVKTNSIIYIISSCITKSHTKILEFLLELPKGLIDWDNIIIQEKSTFVHILSYKLFCSNENIVDKIINLDLDYLDFWYRVIDSKTPIENLFENGNENQLLQIIKTKKFDINKLFDTKDYLFSYQTTIINILITRKFIKILEYIFENNYEINYENDKPVLF